MSIKETLLEDFKKAMREKDTLTKEVLQICRAEILQVEKDKKTQMNDEGVIEVLSRELKKRSDTIAELGDREDIKEKYMAEMAVIKRYLPEQMSEDELTETVKLVIEQTGASSMRDMGKVMAALMPKVKGRADGKRVNSIVRKMLGS